MRVVAVMACCALLALAGCGASKSSGKSGASAATTRRQVCDFAGEAQGVYQTAVNEIALQFNNKKLVSRALVKLEQFKVWVEKVHALADAGERAELDKTLAALDQQATFYSDFIHGDRAAALHVANAEGLGAKIEEGRRAFADVCQS